MKTTARDVLLFVPNLIGYVRIILALAAFYVIKTDYIIASSCYIISGLLDAFDGHAARMLNQGTKFGAMLDQLTDRAATACLVVTLASFYPEYSFWFQLSLALDIVSHWMHLHVSLVGGVSHKNIGLEGNPIMRLYYTSRPVLFVMCSGNELFFAMLYVLNFTEGPYVEMFNVGLPRLILYISTPIMILKTVVSAIHLVDASTRLAAIDAEERSKDE